MLAKSTETLKSRDRSLSLNWFHFIALGSFHILALFAPYFFSWDALGVAIFMHWFCGSIGICLGYHRLLTHRSFKLLKWLEYVVVTIGVLALQGGPIFWVGTHRMHHAFTEDNERDPYSAKRGFWWSHILWILYPRGQSFNREAHCQFAPKLARNAYYCWLERYFFCPSFL